MSTNTLNLQQTIDLNHFDPPVGTLLSTTADTWRVLPGQVVENAEVGRTGVRSFEACEDTVFTVDRLPVNVGDHVTPSLSCIPVGTVMDWQSGVVDVTSRWTKVSETHWQSSLLRASAEIDQDAERWTVVEVPPHVGQWIGVHDVTVPVGTVLELCGFGSLDGSGVTFTRREHDWLRRLSNGEEDVVQDRSVVHEPAFRIVSLPEAEPETEVSHEGDEWLAVRESMRDYSQRVRSTAVGILNDHSAGGYGALADALDELGMRAPTTPYVGLVLHRSDYLTKRMLPEGTTVQSYLSAPSDPTYGEWRINRYQDIDGEDVSQWVVVTGLPDVETDDGAGDPATAEEIAERRAVLHDLGLKLKASEEWCGWAERTMAMLGIPQPDGDLLPEDVRALPVGSVVRWSEGGYSRLFRRVDGADNPAGTEGVGHTFGSWTSRPTRQVHTPGDDMEIEAESVNEMDAMPDGTLLRYSTLRLSKQRARWIADPGDHRYGSSDLFGNGALCYFGLPESPARGQVPIEVVEPEGISDTMHEVAAELTEYLRQHTGLTEIERGDLLEVMGRLGLDLPLVDVDVDVFVRAQSDLYVPSGNLESLLGNDVSVESGVELDDVEWTKPLTITVTEVEMGRCGCGHVDREMVATVLNSYGLPSRTFEFTTSCPND